MTVTIRKITTACLLLTLMTALFIGCTAPVDDENSITFTDSCGRTVKLPGEITRIAPSGAVATMILATVAPEYLVCISSTPSSVQIPFLSSELLMLPTTGQFYGTRSTMNLESLLDADPQVIIDLGDTKDGIASDMNLIQKQTGIPTIFIEADLNNLADAYRTLGELIYSKSERGDTLAAFIDETLEMARNNKAKLKTGDIVSVMYTSGTSGLGTHPQDSLQAQVLELVGVKNAVVIENVSNSGGGNPISMEQLYIFEPEVILFSQDSIYCTVGTTATWLELNAIRNDRYFEVPMLPYNWLASPPSVNMTIGVWWLGNLIYPDLYNYDMAEKTQEIYKLFWNYDLSDDEVRQMLQNSTLKNH